MAPLTPAQKAVLERIEKKKELQKKTAMKRKAKTDPVPDTTSNQDTTVIDTDADGGASKKRRRLEADEPNNNTVEASTSKKDSKKAKTTSAAQENEDHATPSVKARRGRKTVNLEETQASTVDESTQQQPVATPVKTSARRAGRKTTAFEEPKESPANQTLNEAQLRVMQMLEAKKAAKEKGRKSLKPPKSEPPKMEEVVDIGSDSELAVSSTVPEPVVRGRRKTKILEATLPAVQAPEKVTASARKRKPPPQPAPVEISEPEEEAPPPSYVADRLSDTRVEDDEEEQKEEDHGPLNATMIAVLEKIKEKKARQPVRKPAAKAQTAKQKTAASTSVTKVPTTSAEGSPSKNSKTLRERKTKEPPITLLDSTDDEDDDESRLTPEEVRALLDRLSVPLNHREKHYAKRLQHERVYATVEQGLPLSKEQNAMLVKFNHVMRTKPSQSAAASLKSSSKSNAISVDDIETEITDEDVRAPAQVTKNTLELDSDEGSEMDFAETKTGKTFLIFDTNAYLKILPYCRAVLESDKLKDEPDFEELVMFTLFVVIRELDSVSKRKRHLKTPALAAIRVIHGALQDKNPRIEGQDYASSKEKLSDSEINDDYILNSADLLQRRGENVIVVTDDKNLQVKIAMMRITSLNGLEFIARFHWLTPLITADVKREVLTIGEDVLARFTEGVVVSIVLKGVLAHLAPLPMERRREIFPSEKLSTTLALMLKNKAILQAHNGPFAVLNYDRVAQTLAPLKKYDEGDRLVPKDEERFKFFARFLASAEILCRSIAGYFPNMETRAELVAAVGSHFQMYLPEEERIAVRRAEPPKRVFEKPSTSRWEPASKALLPTKKAPPAAPVIESPKVVAQRSVSDRRRTLASAAAAAERTRVEEPPQPAVKPRATRQTRTPRTVQAEEPEEEAEPVYFSFSQGRQTQNRFEPEPVEEIPKPYALTPTRTATRQPPSDPYSDLHDSITEDVAATVYEYFQKFGLSICNYTGSCCVKLGVRFSLAFKVSTARLETSLPEVTDSFALVLKAMKKIIMGSPTSGPAREFLLHSSQVMDAIGRSDPDLVNSLPKISPDALLSFCKDPEGKQQLVTGYQQFCDFNNCLEKCWLEAQRL